VIERAPGKVNLSLFVGAPRGDGLHPLVSVVQAVSLADELTMVAAEADEVVCPAIEGPNLAAAALAAFRAATGWTEPQRITIAKRIPVAAGMGGGSADAAAVLRLAARAAGGVDDVRLHELAVRLGADVPSLLFPGRVVMTGAGEHIDRLPDPDPFGLLIVPSQETLSTPAVYREFDRLGGARTADELAARRADALAGDVPPVNDLAAAACSLCPAIEPALAAVRSAGASVAMVSGSGPTVFGLFDTPDAARAAAAVVPGAIAAEPV
jgi:4-diphosphocytidyl-2-C-methyl-D-erythritol kinase